MLKSRCPLKPTVAYASLVRSANLHVSRPIQSGLSCHLTFPLRQGRAWVLHAEVKSQVQEERHLQGVPDELYETDYNAWLDAVAHQVRAGNLATVNSELLAEALEDFSNISKAKARGLAAEIMTGLLKLDYWGAAKAEHKEKWVSQIFDWRNDPKHELENSESVREHLEDDKQFLYEVAAKFYASAVNRPVNLGGAGGGALPLPYACPYTFDQVLDFDFDGIGSAGAAK